MSSAIRRRSSLPLLSHHRAELEASGLTDRTIQKCGFYSEHSVLHLMRLLNTNRLATSMAPALVFPFLTPDGKFDGYARVKPDHPRRDKKGKVVKYESPRGEPNRAFFPPTTLQVLQDYTVPLLITEGEKKAAKADQEGFPCIGLVGVYGWKLRGKEMLLPELREIPWRRRDTYIVFDSDAAINPNVARAEARLAAILRAAGENVRVIRLPDLID